MQRSRKNEQSPEIESRTTLIAGASIFGLWPKRQKRLALCSSRLHLVQSTGFLWQTMIDKTKIIDAVCERLEALPVNHCLDLRTYKRNRSVTIVKEAEDDLLIIENGFFKERFRTQPVKLRKMLKTLIKKEFPRSRKIRLYVLDTFEEDPLNKRKIL
jgi:hypothetical protein